MARSNISGASRQRSNPPTQGSDLDRLLLSPETQARIARFRVEGKAFDLEETPRLLDQLLDLNCVELHKLLKAFGLSHLELRRQRQLRPGPATAEQVLQILSGGGVGGAGSGRTAAVPATLRQADSFLRSTSAELGRTTDPILRQRLERRRSELQSVRGGLEKLPRRRGLGHFGFYGQLAVSARLFKFQGHDSEDPEKQRRIEEKRRQGGFFELDEATAGSRFLSDHLKPGVGLSPALFIGEKDRKLGRRKWELSLNVPTLSSHYGGAYHTFRPPSQKGAKHFGYHLAGPANLAFSDDPVVGKSIRIKYQFVFSLFIGERYLGFGWYPKKYAEGFELPGITSARALPHFGVGIQSDFIYYLTGPLLELLSRAGEKAVTWIKAMKPKESSAASENSAPYPNRSASGPEAHAAGDLPNTSMVASTV